VLARLKDSILTTVLVCTTVFYFYEYYSSTRSSTIASGGPFITKFVHNFSIDRPIGYKSNGTGTIQVAKILRLDTKELS
jgi:hypothetical protein